MNTNITYEDLIEILTDLEEHWGEDGKKVVAIAYAERQGLISYPEFLKHCTACGGNWGGLLLTGMKELFPHTYEAIPEQMGSNAFGLLINVLTLLGVVI